MEKQKTLVQQLLENEIWNFWAKGWTKKITVQWNGDLKKLEPYKKQILKKLGRGWGYERSVNGAIGHGPAPDLIIK